MSLKIARRFRFLLAVTLPVLVLSDKSRAFAEEPVDRPIGFVEIASNKQFEVYKVTRSRGAISVTSIHSRSPTIEQGSIADVTSSVVKRRYADRQAAAMIPGSAEHAFKWANLSPDKSCVLVGFQDPSVSAMTSAAVYRVAGLELIRHIEPEGRISDSLWSQDSKLVMILEVTERAKKTPWGLLAALSGHPIEIQTFDLRVVDVESKSEVRVKVADGIENGQAELRLDQ